MMRRLFIAGTSLAPEHKLWRLRLQYWPPAGSRAQVQWFWSTGSVAPWLVGSSQTRDQTHLSCTGRRILNHWITRGALFFIFLLEYNCFFFFFLGGEVRGFPHSSVSKESACNAGDPGSIPRSGRPPGEGNGNPFQYSCLENPMDGGAWQATVHGVARVEQELATELPLL